MIVAGVLLVAIVAAAVWLFLVRGGEPTAGVETTTSTSPTTASAVVTNPTTTSPAPTTTLTTLTTTTSMTASTDSTEAVTTTLGTPLRFEQSDSRIAYSGDWTVVTSTSASGGDFLFSNAAGASITIMFDGTYLAWIAKKSPVYGKAQVTLDGKSLGTVDLYAETAGWQLKVWGTGNLKPGVHTLVIERTGTKNPAATGTIVGVDAFDVVGSLVKATQ